MQNAVPDEVAMRSLGDRYAAYTAEVDRLLRAGLEVMRRSQSLNPKVTDVVREAGLNNQAFYRHFRSKDELLLAILDDGARQLVDYVTHLMAKETSPTAKIRRWVEGIMAQAIDPVAADATRPFVVESLRLTSQFPEQAQRSEERLRAPLRTAIAEAASTLELPYADPLRDGDAVYYLAVGSMQGYLVRGEVPSKFEVDHLVAFVIAGLARDPHEQHAAPAGVAARKGRRGA